MMASKKELAEKLALLTAERDLLATEVQAHARRESERMEREHREAQERLKEQERIEREEHLDDLREGVLRIKNAAEHSVSTDDRGVIRLDVTFTLDAEELELVNEVTKPKPKTSWAELQDRVNENCRRLAYLIGTSNPLLNW